MSSSAKPAPSQDDADFYISPQDRDLMIRMTMAEAGREPDAGKVGVAHVILNRVASGRYGGNNPTAIITAPKQFEPWSTRRDEVLGYDPQSEAYRRTAAIIDGVLDGSLPDVTQGRTHFLNKSTVMQRSGALPSWAQGDGGLRIGNHTFLAPEGLVTSYTGLKPDKADASALAPALKAPPKASPAAPKPPGEMSDDELMGLLAGPVAKAAPAAGSAPLALKARPQPNPADLSDDDLMGLLSAGAKSTAPAGASSAPTAKAVPVMSGDGLRDSGTGELVVAGKGFSDNRAAAGGPIGGAGQAASDGALLGAAPALQAFGAALKEKMTNGGNLRDLYQQAYSVYAGGRQQYRAEHPIANALAETAGSIPTTVAATTLGGAALAGPGNLLLDAMQGSRLAGPAAAAGRFVTGQGGAGQGALALAEMVASRGTAGAASGAFGGAINSGLTGGDVADNALTGAMVGGAVGGSLPAIGAAASGTLNKLTGTASPERAALGRLAQDLGVPVRAAEISDGPILRKADSIVSKLPGMGYGGIDAAKQAAVNRATAAAIGETGDRVTQGTMAAAKRRIGAAFDRVAANSTVKLDTDLAGDLGSILTDATRVLPEAETRMLRGIVQDINNRFGSAQQVAGDAFLGMTKSDAPLSRLMKGDSSNLRYYAGQVRTALEDALERSAPANLVGDLRQARSQYRAMKTIEPLVADDAAGHGNIDPRALYTAVTKATDDMAYGRGGDLADLARVALVFGPKAAQAVGQDAAARSSFANKLFGSVGALGGAAAGLDKALPIVGPYVSGMALPVAGGMAAGLGAGLGAGRVASQVLRSRALTNRLMDDALGPRANASANRLAPIMEGARDLMLGAAPETAAPLYLRVRPPANDDSPANKLDEFIRSRPQRTGSSVN